MSLVQWSDIMEYQRLADKKEPLTEAERQWLADYLLREKLDWEEQTREDVEDVDERTNEDDADQG